MKKTAHVIPHSHWDREWYMPFEHHRARLIALIDDVLELLENENYPSYHLDGQTIALEDYLEIRPHKRQQVEKLVREGRLQVGPFYVLQDTYLTGSEANARNLLRGVTMAKNFGGVCKAGYLPDAFGNAGQFPQMFAQAGMNAAVYGRGVTMVGKEGKSDPVRHHSRSSEFMWEGPDGTRIPAVYFANWYNNGMEIPADPEEAKAWWTKKLADTEKYAATNQLLFMNGCDHQPVQKDLPEALETARKLFPDVDFVHSSFENFVARMLESAKEPLEVISGELEDQQSKGFGTLRNTASARWYLKKLNRENEVLLEKTVEPLAVMSGVPGDNDLLNYAWKLLMQNHPHDSICGCSIDEVHREMVSRYHRSIQLGQWLAAQSRAALAKRIQVDGIAFAVWNPGAWERTGVVSAVVDVERVYGTQDARAQLAGKPLKEYRLLGSDGSEIPCTIEDLGVHFGYDLPEDRFRDPYYERRLRVTFEAKNVPAFGYDAYRLEEGVRAATEKSLVSGANCLENEFLRVEIREDGSFDLFDKRTGRKYSGLGVYEECGDVGDEYVFRKAVGDTLMTKGIPAKIVLSEDSPARAAYTVEHVLTVPACAAEELCDAMEKMEWREWRNIGRGAETVEMKIRTTITLSRSGDSVEIRSEFNNNAKDHRLRMLFPTDVAGDVHYADSVFDLVRRNDIPGEDWVNPSRCDRMQLYVAAMDEQAGLGIANRGLYEYEILPERKTIAVTLLRGVAELGDWGVFPTPEAQCLGDYSMELSVIPLAGNAAEGLRKAHVYQTELSAAVIRGEGGDLPMRGSFLSWRGENLICTALKKAEDGKGSVLRVFNPTEETSVLEIDRESVRMSNILEETGEMLQAEGGVVRIPVGAKKIVTVRLEK